MITHLHNIFPEGISDETAFHLVEFFMYLSSELDVHYFAQSKRYQEENSTMNPTKYIRKNNNIKLDENF